MSTCQEKVVVMMVLMIFNEVPSVRKKRSSCLLFSEVFSGSKSKVPLVMKKCHKRGIISRGFVFSCTLQE